MKFFEKWLGQESGEDMVAVESRQSSADSCAAREPGDKDEYNEDSSFSWLGDDQDYSKIPSSLLGTEDEKSSTDTVTVRTLTITEDSPYTVEGDAGLDDTVPARTLTLCDGSAGTGDEDNGIDPYNTTRLKVIKQAPPGG